MRKRKSPIALMTVLAVVVCGVVGFQFATSQKGGNPSEAPPAPTTEAKPVGDPRAATDTKTVAQSVKSAIGGGDKASAQEAMPSPKGAPGMGGPMILNPAASTGKPTKPQPNSSSTSTQWYNNESALSSDKG